MAIRAGILTVSDKGARGEREDTSGAAIREMLATIGAAVERYEVVPDETNEIAPRLKEWADDGVVDLILTDGGTGLAPRDVTPEATLSVIDRLAPGIAEAMRWEGLRSTPRAMLSRGVAGVRKQTLIVNLPGSERAVRESLACILPVLEHAVDTVKGIGGDHAPGPAGGARG